MKIAVIGVGTAGLTSLSHCLAWLPKEYNVYSIHDPSTPILGIGESTGTAIPQTLYQGARFTLLRDAEELDATVKHGVKYTGWREQDFYSNIVPPHQAMHFNNFKLKEFCFKRFQEIYSNRFQEIHTKILDITQDDTSAIVVTDADQLKFDYIIDCRGYPDDYTDYNISNYIPVNHCLVNMIPEPGHWNYTYHIAHRNGWMFGIPLQTRQGFGYLYNDTITDKEDAIDDIAERFKTKPQDLNLREFKFKNYSAKKFIDGRIIKNGNRAVFFEPIEALSGWFYDRVMRYFIDRVLFNAREDYLNQLLTDTANDYESFICYIYHGGSMYKSKFWDITVQKSSEKLKNDSRFNGFISQLKDIYKSNEQPPISTNTAIGVFAISNWEDFDKNLGYHYFTPTTQSKW